MIALVTALGGLWSLEQPSGSVLEYYPTWRHLMAKIFDQGGVHSVPKVLSSHFCFAWFVSVCSSSDGSFYSIARITIMQLGVTLFKLRIHPPASIRN